MHKCTFYRMPLSDRTHLFKRRKYRTMLFLVFKQKNLKFPTTLPFFDATEEMKSIPPVAVRNLTAIRDSLRTISVNSTDG